VEEEDDRPEEQ
jgi:hypothetical protein